MSLNSHITQQIQSLGGMNAVAIRKYLSDVLKDKYGHNQEIIERLATVIITARDLQDFGKLISDVYEIGFMKAVDDYRHLLGTMGKEIKITSPPEKPEGKPIFRQRNQETP